MRIALSTSVMQRGRSGVGQYVQSLVRALLPSASRHEFTLFVLEEDVPLLDFASTAMRIVPVGEQNRPPVRDILWHQTQLPGLLKRLGIDVLHVPSYRRMLWPRPCTLVSTIHDLAPFRVSGKYDPLRMLYGRQVCSRLARRQDRVIAVSRTTSVDLEGFFGVAPHKIDVIPNGLDHDRFNPGQKSTAWQAVCLPHGIHGPFFLYVARLEHPAKNHAGLIEAFCRFKDSKVSNWRLALAGGDWHGSAEIRSAARNSRHARDIVFLGFVPNSDLPSWYRAADVFVFPSHYEGFGLPPVEAMACGCPTLSSAAGALAETTGGAAGLLNPSDPAQMQAQMTRVSSDTDWRAGLRTAGLKRAAAFSWAACAEGTLGAYLRAHSDTTTPTAWNLPWGRSNAEEEVPTYSPGSTAAGRMGPVLDAAPSSPIQSL